MKKSSILVAVALAAAIVGAETRTVRLLCGINMVQMNVHKS